MTDEALEGLLIGMAPQEEAQFRLYSAVEAPSLVAVADTLLEEELAAAAEAAWEPAAVVTAALEDVGVLAVAGRRPTVEVATPWSIAVMWRRQEKNAQQKIVCILVEEIYSDPLKMRCANMCLCVHQTL